VTCRRQAGPSLSPSQPMPSATTLTAIAAVITIPLIFTLLGTGRDAGLIIGVVLVAVGVGWSVIGSRGPSDRG
jgi:hypothetical protein